MYVPTVKEAYRILGLIDPLKWERERSKDNAKHGSPDLRCQTGTTTRLLIEACLDAMWGNRVVYVGATPSDPSMFRQSAIKILGALGGSLKLVDSTLVFTTREGWKLSKAHGNHFDAVYQDHYRGVGEDKRPLPGPYGHIRTIEQDSTHRDRWNAKDFDGDFVLALDEHTAHQIQQDQPDRIRLVPLPTTQPAGSTWEAPVSAIATGHLDIANGMVLGERTDLFDGHAVEAGDRVLLTQQQDPSENGVFEITGGGSNLTCLAPEPTPASGTLLIVQSGDLYAGTMWIYDTGTWLQIRGAGSGTSLEPTRISSYTDSASGDEHRKVVLLDGTTLHYRNGLLESVERAGEVDGPDDPSLPISL